MRYATMLLALVVVFVAAPAWADFEAGAEAYFRGDYATALKEFRVVAEQGDAGAQAILGVMYDMGRGVPQDGKEALRWYRLAAEQGDAYAQVNLGLMYQKGKGVPQDSAEAARWFRLAAEQGEAYAQYNLGKMYENGRGVPQDFVQAHLWFNLSAAQGDEPARKGRDLVAEKMTLAQLTEARRLVREWTPKGK